MVYFTSDLHFGHEKLCRGLRGMSAEESDKLIIDNWNKVITKHDTVYVLGDVTMEKHQKIEEYIKQLKGDIVIIGGNHDKRRCCKEFQRLGIQVLGCMTYKGFICLHIPLHPGGAELFCNEFNRIFEQIDMYADHSKSSCDYYIDELNNLTKIETIKEVMKCGFFSEEIYKGGKYICNIPEFESAQKDAKQSLDYIQWDGETNNWEKIGDDYVITETLPRFIVGTYEEISDVIKKCGSPYKNPDPNNEFPVWCNSEVIVLYMKNGYLTYTTR